MGTDIHGWIEVKNYWDEGWSGIVKIDQLVNRNYDLFGCLFGVTNYANFKSIAGNRGIPADASPEVTKDLLNWFEEYECKPKSPSWITWEEIKAIDWDEEAEEWDERPHRYLKTQTGELEYQGKGFESHFDELFWQNLQRNKIVEIDKFVYKFEKLQRKDALPSAQLLLSWLEKVAQDFKDHDIRLIVWFDS